MPGSHSAYAESLRQRAPRSALYHARIRGHAPDEREARDIAAAVAGPALEALDAFAQKLDARARADRDEVLRVAGQVAAGFATRRPLGNDDEMSRLAIAAVAFAREIVAEVDRPPPESSDSVFVRVVEAAAAGAPLTRDQLEPGGSAGTGTAAVAFRRLLAARRLRLEPNPAGIDLSPIVVSQEVP